MPPLAGRPVEAVAEADRIAGSVVGDRQRAEPRVDGVPGHDRPAAGRRLVRAAASPPRTPRLAGRAGR